MNTYQHQKILNPIIVVLFFFMAGLMTCFSPNLANAAGKTILVSAEGLADPQADIYQNDKGKLLDALRQDAKRQVIEKAVGSYVESSTLVENYALIHDKILTRTKGLIKRVIKESPPWKGEDGFMHMLLKAEVYLSSIKDSLQVMSKTERLSLLKDYGNPKISVAITIRDAKRGSRVAPERSDVAENILKERFAKFGYRVWSEDAGQLDAQTADRTMPKNQSNATTLATHIKTSDFSIRGEVKFKSLTATLQASGLTITKYVLTSWTIKCINNYTSEEVYFNNTIPRNKSWSDEDAAMDDIGKLIGEQFSKGFFEDHLMRTSKIFQLEIFGLPDYDTGTLFKKEMIGLRPVMNVDFRNFDAQGLSFYEIDFAGTRGNFTDIINDTVIKPLNRKFGKDVFKLVSARGDVVRVDFHTTHKIDDLPGKFNKTLPASLSEATPERIENLARTEATMTQVARINPEAVQQLSQKGNKIAEKALAAVNDF
ncbi:hypothetical protein [Desulfobacula toluolica]|uniref:Conserved uncharacterized protein n=1 Tax=Desulfobacula toluolica (strain DSM 7467 / Tol2) TaxID=651182 RepID=K0NJ38_DESTT|nr:hypothetical protein [Desulfobacula toluolica]CCK81481.1 conserved uncharacterized protein [Desulfobacula toluolica Tol2]